MKVLTNGHRNASEPNAVYPSRSTLAHDVGLRPCVVSAQVVDKLRGFRHSADPREQMVFRCMIHNLFDEYQFFHNYPDKVRRNTMMGIPLCTSCSSCQGIRGCHRQCSILQGLIRSQVWPGCSVAPGSVAQTACG